MTDIVAHLAKRGLVFLKGVPPKEEDGFLLLYTGGCNPQLGFWDYAGRCLREIGSRDLIPVRNVDSWMRLPNPSFWPEVDAPSTLIEERALYGLDKTVFETAAEQLP